MDATIWHNPNCSTSRKVHDLLRARGINLHVVRYLDNVPTEADIRAVLKEAGIAARELLRKRAEIYAELALDDAKWTDDELIGLMLKHPVLIERPVVRTIKGARLCRPAEKVEEIL